MNQTCKVCGEPAAGFHFGAFTCEGCKSFFGRSYNNLSSISDCKNNGECIINKKNRTACKACRLRKCLMVGMSKSGSRYGRRSNWFKIHCLLQEQQQQAAAAMAAHHNNQQQAAAAAAAAHAAAQHGGVPPTSLLPGQKPPPPPLPGAAGMGVQPPPPPSSAAAAAALGMLGHAGAYPGLYPPRTKEELLMLGLEEYAAAAAAAKHPTNASPSVSSPDSHNSDSSVDVNTRNPLLHLGGGAKHLSAADSAAGAPPQLRKDLPHFLPLPFAGLGGMPVMPPPAFLPPSHLLFPGYHPALYAPHHQSLLKPSPEQQQQAAAAAAAVHQLFNTSNATPSRFPPSMNAPNSPLTNAAAAAAAAAAATSMVAHKMSDKEERTVQSPKSDALNNNHIPNGSKAAEELTKRFYLDAVLKSQQRNSPPPTTTKLPEHTRHHDHSISALVTPNSDSGRELLRSRQSNDDAEEEEANSINNSSAHVTLTSRRSEEQMHTHATNIAVSNAPSTLTAPAADTHSNGGNDGSDSAGEAELVVSMTPPRSPLSNREAPTVAAASTEATGTAPALQSPRRTKQQDNPIDLSMKTGSSIASSLSSKCSSSGSVQATDSDNEHEGAIEVERRSSRDSATTAQTTAAQELLQIDVDVDVEVDDDDEHEIEAALPFKRNGASRNNNNANSSNTSSSSNNNNNNDNNRNCNASTARFSSSDSDESGMKLDAVKRKLHANKPQHSDTLQQLQHAYTADADALQVKRLKLCAKEANVLAIEKLSAAVKLNSGGNVGAAAVTSGTPPAATTTPLDLTTKV